MTKLIELLKKAQTDIKSIRSATAGFEHPTQNANNMLPGKRSNPSKPNKHIRADTQTEVNFVKENDLKKSDGGVTKWRVKLHGKKGYFPIIDVIAAMHGDEYERYDLGEHGIVHPREVEDLQYSIPLEKAHVAEDYMSHNDTFSGMNEKKNDHEKTMKIGYNLYHHVFKEPNGNLEKWHHIISQHAEPWRKGVSEIITSKPLGYDGAPSVEYSAVHPHFEGKGYGKKAYIQAVKYHGSLQSPNDNKSQKAWQQLGDYKDFKTQMDTDHTGNIKRTVSFRKEKPSKVKNAMFQVFGKSDDLEKGLKGDWKKEGYQIKHENTDDGGILITAHHPNTPYKVGFVDIPGNNIKREYMHSKGTFVDQDHQRKGLGTAMYQYAENLLGRKMKPSNDRTKMGKLFWKKGQKQWGHTLFGKSDDLEKAEKNQKIRWVADQYANKKGFSINHNVIPADINPERSKAIAKEFHNMQHNPNDPKVKSAYNKLIGETLDQFEHILGTSGLKVSKIHPKMENPYKNGSKDLFSDVNKNNHMWYYPTEQGFGSSDKDFSDHPLMQNVKTSIGAMPANDVFRIVHDYFGHVKEGLSFGPKGEEGAWRHHMQMYSPEAQKALTSETRGQNSWVNFGPHGEANRANPANTIYADQKAGLLPDWTLQTEPHQQQLQSVSGDFEMPKPSKLGKSMNTGGKKYNGRHNWRVADIQNEANEWISNNNLEKSLPSEKIYVAFDGDNAGSQVERAALKDDLNAIKDISMRIKNGSLAVIQLAKEIDPETLVIIHGGDDIGLLMSNKIGLQQIDLLRERYQQVAKFTITAGIGESIPQATHALLYGKLTGKNKTVQWEPKISEQLQQMKYQESPEEKVRGILSDGQD